MLCVREFMNGIRGIEKKVLHGKSLFLNNETLGLLKNSIRA